MITSDFLKNRFEFYRKWLNTLLVKEFLNLPYREQSRFMALIGKFTEDCKKVHEEAIDIKEKSVIINVEKIIKNSNLVIGKIPESSNKINIKYPQESTLPAIGDSICCIIYSKDEEEWFSSKEELITGRVK